MAIDWGPFMNRGRVGIDWWVDGQNDTDYNVRFDIWAQTDYTLGYNYDVRAYIAGTPGAQGPFTQRLSGNTPKLMFSGWMWLKKKPGVTQVGAFTVLASAVGTGFGEASHSKTGDIPAGSSRPSAPGTPTASAIRGDGTGCTISWAASSSNGGSAINGYLLRYKEGTTVSESGYTDHSFQNNLSRAVTGLTKGKTYTFWVYARNGSADNSGYSNRSGARTVTMPKEPSAPATPSNTFTAPNTLKLSWSAPSNNGASITGYDIQYDDNSSFSSPTTVSTTSTSYTFTVSTSNYGKTLYFRVRAKNSVGPGGYSGVTSRAIPNKPSTPATPSNTFTAPGSITVSWSAPSNNGAGITGYTLQYADNSSFSSATTVSTTSTSYTFTVPSSGYGKTWYFRVLATNSQGSSSYSSAGSRAVPNKPSTPGTPTLVYTAPTTVKISWSAPANNGASITGYTVQYADNSSFTSAKTVTTTSTSVTVSDVTVGKTWYFRVLATNSQGSSSYSSAANVLVVCGPRVRIGGVWKNTIAYVRIGGVWKVATPYVRTGGAWKIAGG